MDRLELIGTGCGNAKRDRSKCSGSTIFRADISITHTTGVALYQTADDRIKVGSHSAYHFDGVGVTGKLDFWRFSVAHRLPKKPLEPEYEGINKASKPRACGNVF